MRRLRHGNFLSQSTTKHNFVIYIMNFPTKGQADSEKMGGKIEWVRLV
jgi:hypothetical protein